MKFENVTIEMEMGNEKTKTLGVGTLEIMPMPKKIEAAPVERFAEAFRDELIEENDIDVREEMLGIIMACMYVAADNETQVYAEYIEETRSINFYAKDRNFFVKVDEYSLESAKEGVYDELIDDGVVDICDMNRTDIYDYDEDILADLLEIHIDILKRALAAKDQKAIDELVRNITDITNLIQKWGNAIVTYSDDNKAGFEGYLVLNGDYKVIDAFTSQEELVAHI